MTYNLILILSILGIICSLGFFLTLCVEVNDPNEYEHDPNCDVSYKIKLHKSGLYTVSLLINEAEVELLDDCFLGDKALILPKFFMSEQEAVDFIRGMKRSFEQEEDEVITEKVITDETLKAERR